MTSNKDAINQRNQLGLKHWRFRMRTITCVAGITYPDPRNDDQRSRWKRTAVRLGCRRLIVDYRRKVQ